MGAKLAKLFDFAKVNGGLVVQMRIAIETGITSASVVTEVDSPENIGKVRDAIKKFAGMEAPDTY